jgi:hypothetical protein
VCQHCADYLRKPLGPSCSYSGREVRSHCKKEGGAGECGAVFAKEDAQKFSVDLERVLLKYDYNDHLRMSFGRYHTGIGYYNTFHSGSWFQTTENFTPFMQGRTTDELASRGEHQVVAMGIGRLS